MSDGRLAAALRELRARGFTDVGYRAGARHYRGELKSSAGALPVRIGIRDWEFLEYPTIYVEGSLAKYPELRPHLDHFGGLCYFGPGLAILDRYNPDIAIAQCLEQAQYVLERILTDPEYVDDDIENEFLVHWEREQPEAVTVSMGPITRGALAAPLHFWGELDTALVAEDPETARTVCEAVGWRVTDSSQNRCWLFSTDKTPPAPRRLATNVAELFEWLRGWDIRMYNAIQRLLGCDTAYEFQGLPIGVHTPIGWLGFMIHLEKVRGAGAAKKKQNLHQHAATTPIRRLAFFDISPEFVHSRNLTFKDLSARRITVIGVGAVGSHVAAALVRLGAGSGEGGLLRLIDEEILMPENLGRHALGYNHLFQSKAKAMREELLRQFPLARIEAFDGSAQDYACLLDSELVVEASGEEALSEYVNARWLRAGRPGQILYLWIKGNGECVQSMWTDSAEYGCFHCLRLNEPGHHRKERFPILKREPQRKILGCHAFTPYAVSAPLAAAALGIDAISDWLRGDPSPRYRTRCRENVDVDTVKDANITPLPDCQGCRAT